MTPPAEDPLAPQPDLDDAAPPPSSTLVDPARFRPALMGPLSAALMQAVPTLVALSPPARDIEITSAAFAAHWMPAGDAIRLIETDIGDPGVIEFQLRQPYRTWFKALEVHIGGTRVAELVCEGNRRRESEVARFEVGQLTGAGFLRFVKAATFGVHTGFYEVRNLQEKRGKRLIFEWLHD